MKRCWIGVLFGALSGCGPAGIATDGSSTGTGEAGTSGADSTSDGSSTSDGDGGTDEGFSCELPPLIDCGLAQAECPDGSKCGYVDGEGCFGEGYGFPTCVPVIGEQSVGEPCSVSYENLDHDPPATWHLDDCDATGSCRLYASDPNQGLCLPFCGWSVDGPELTCDDPGRICLGGERPVCWQRCDPLAEPSCEGGFVCGLRQSGVGGVFHCGRPSPPSAGQIGESCGSNYGCADGLVCVEAERLPDCDSNYGCCSPLCSLEAIDPCAELGPAYTCVPYYNPGFEPPGLEHVGICAGL